MNSRLLIGTLALLAATWCCKKGADQVSVQPRSDYLEAGAGSMFVTVTATKDWTLSLEYPAGTDAWASVDPASGSASRNDVRLRFEANAAGQERQLTLVLHGQGAQASATITQAGKSTTPPGPDGPGSYGYGYDVAPGNLNWLELPATKAGDGCELLIHNMQGGRYAGLSRDGTRNWSCYWDYQEHLSLWVAYPLNRSLIGKGDRTDAWGFDPLLPTALQPDLTARSYGGGWSRGHQIPSADRLTYAANVSTFYPTNMTPQNNSFNGGIWAKLETAVRKYADYTDTLYVVTGCLYQGSTTTSGTSSGFAVRIPTHYYKALLAHTTGGTQGQDGYLAAGFFLSHDASIGGGNYVNYICSIDQLEEKTGIDFFPNLIRKIGQDKAGLVESTTPGNWWK